MEVNGEWRPIPRSDPRRELDIPSAIKSCRKRAVVHVGVMLWVWADQRQCTATALDDDNDDNNNNNNDNDEDSYQTSWRMPRLFWHKYRYRPILQQRQRQRRRQQWKTNRRTQRRRDARRKTPSSMSSPNYFRFRRRLQASSTRRPSSDWPPATWRWELSFLTVSCKYTLGFLLNFAACNAVIGYVSPVETTTQINVHQCKHVTCRSKYAHIIKIILLHTQDE